MINFLQVREIKQKRDGWFKFVTTEYNTRDKIKHTVEQTELWKNFVQINLCSSLFQDHFTSKKESDDDGSKPKGTRDQCKTE